MVIHWYLYRLSHCQGTVLWVWQDTVGGGGIRASPWIKRRNNLEVKVFIDVFKLCTFPTDHTKEFAGKSVHSGKKHRKGKKKWSHRKNRKNTPQVTRTPRFKKAMSINTNYTSITKTWWWWVEQCPFWSSWGLCIPFPLKQAASLSQHVTLFPPQIESLVSAPKVPVIAVICHFWPNITQGDAKAQKLAALNYLPCWWGRRAGEIRK